MGSAGFHNRDKALNSFHNLLEISWNYGFAEHNPDSLPNIDKTSNKIHDILQQIEAKNEILNGIIQLINPSDMNRLKNSLKQTSAFDCKYLLALKTFKNSLRNILDNMDRIIEKINKQNSSNNIKMEFKYQKLVAQFLDDTQKELIECEENARLFNYLKTFLREFGLNSNIVKYDFEFVSIYEKLKQSIELLIKFNEKLNEMKRKTVL
ncbi:hypothetical protein BpHYR1_043418 [Brachionus plicatilis]|uniref:Uncharacterized protein n=1 Tax=Brachionus plicatilis TaxID=10195 RepID=A0A3M7QBS1_BRAPC|nr:hypothetical protein BpHYR1_043418 [Brachionus plicatilis]